MTKEKAWKIGLSRQFSLWIMSEDGQGAKFQNLVSHLKMIKGPMFKI